MKKNTLLPDSAGVAPSYDYGDGAPMPAPAAANDGLIFDDGEPFALAAAGSGSVSAGSAKPVAAISTLADYLINGFWQYNGTFAHHWASNTITYNIGGLNAAEKFLAQSALQAWHDVANVTFVLSTGAANITFSDAGTMQAVTGGSWYGNGAMASANVDISSDWIVNDGGAMDGKTGIDSYGYQTYIHEIGHALGLGHQGPYNGSAVYSTDALYADDTWQYSIMSYFSQNNYFGSTYRYVVSPQMADIYAVGQIYGADTTTRTGDTVYGFHSNAGAVFDFNAYTRAPAFTIYDSGGNDTLDCSGYSAAQTIDLHAGAFSSVGGLVNNIGIALNSNIETGIGGSGNNTLIANDNGCTLIGGAGNDTLIGGAGNDQLIGGPGVDIMTGGGGANTFVFATGDSSAAAGQHDRITDFKPGVDHIDFSGFDAIASTSGYDLFRFIGMSAFDGSAGELDYFYNSALGVTVLQGDTNGDKVADFAIDLVGNLTLSLGDFIGVAVAPITIESQGALSLTELGSNFYLGTLSGTALKYAGVNYFVGQIGGWTATGAERTSTGYEVAWKVAGADQYTIWNADNGGNYVSSLIGVVSGSSVALEAFETSFQQDLNGDGIIGVPPAVVVEALGATKLDRIGSAFYLDAVSSGAGTGPLLKWSGADFYAGELDGWTPIGVEKTSTGYEVAWKIAGADQYTVWNADNGGNYVSSLVGVVSGSSVAFEALESSFQQDLNGDGHIGVAASAVSVEAFGATELDRIGNAFYLDAVSGGAGTGPSLKWSGADFYAGELDGWTPIGVEKTSTGYEVAWKMTGADQYTIWNADNGGNYVSSLIGVVSGSNAAFKAFETSFQQDLNSDGSIGVTSAVVVEAFGATKLDNVGSNSYLDAVGSGAATGPSLKWSGADFHAGELDGWTPIGVEKTSTGYEVAWKIAGADQYTIWNADNGGNYVSSLVGVVSGSNTAFKSFETSFHQDLNSDGTIGSSQASLAAAPASQSAMVAAVSNDSFTFKQDLGAGNFANGVAPAAAHGGEILPVASDHQLPQAPHVADMFDSSLILGLHPADAHAGFLIL